MYQEHSEVKLVDHMGSDLSIIRAAQVSVKGGNEPTERKAGLINYLMKARHGSVFESGVMTFYIKTQIFTSRQIMRHRISSPNEVSGRYKELEPLFYIPPVDRPLVNEGSGAHPKLVPGNEKQYQAMLDTLADTYQVCWEAYQDLLRAGVATEIARAVLPVGMFTELYMTFNLRSLMNFLSLRVQSPTSKPQWEIEEVARMMEEAFQEKFPTVHDAFIKNGRVAP